LELVGNFDKIYCLSYFLKLTARYSVVQLL